MTDSEGRRGNVDTNEEQLGDFNRLFEASINTSARRCSKGEETKRIEV